MDASGRLLESERNLIAVVHANRAPNDIDLLH